MTYCSVCGNRVNTNANIVSEHNYQGKICYGSFMPLKNPEFSFETQDRPDWIKLNKKTEGFYIPPLRFDPFGDRDAASWRNE